MTTGAWQPRTGALWRREGVVARVDGGTHERQRTTEGTDAEAGPRHMVSTRARRARRRLGASARPRRQALLSFRCTTV
jgi:hypothetical protein